MSMVRKMILEEFTRTRSDYLELGDVVHNRLDEMVQEAGLSILGIEHRIKTVKSLAGKLERKGEDYYRKLEDLTDLVGARIICFFADEVDVLGKLVEQNFQVDPENSYDKRALMKADSFGYLSLHYVCSLTPDMGYPEKICYKKFEIQIRTNLQHTWSAIEHDLGYKSEFGVPRVVVRQFARLAGLLELADDEFVRIRSRMQEYTEEIRQKIAQGCADDVQIDLISLEEYMKRNQEMRSFLAELSALADSGNGPAEISEVSVETYVQQLHWLGITTIGNLQRMLSENRELALTLAGRVLGSTDFDILSSSIGLRYLCRALLLKQRYTREQIAEFFRLSTSNAKRAERMANELLKSVCLITDGGEGNGRTEEREEA